MQVVSIGQKQEATREGNYFVSNYPPFSFWKPERINEASAAIDREPVVGTPLGIYLHIPFCRKRCHFCYFKVYTGMDSTAIESYLDAMRKEMALYAALPSYLSTKQLGDSSTR